MKIIEKHETITYTVDFQEWNGLVERYGRENAGKFLKSDGWSISDEVYDEFGLYAKITFTKTTVPAVVAAKTSLWSFS